MFKFDAFIYLNPIMNKKIFLFILSFISLHLNAQPLLGAWEKITKGDVDEEIKTIIIITENYFSSTSYEVVSGQFLETKGGSWKLENEIMLQEIEFDTTHPENVGQKIRIKTTWKGDRVEFGDKIFQRIDDSLPGALHGAWLMYARVVDGQTQKRETETPRKTMKLLSGTRFQWIAYNTETKQFMGTGGGTYTTKNGKYTEKIEFFSRDISRVGLSLGFNYDLKDGKWHHTGFSSKGDPIDEYWHKRK